MLKKVIAMAVSFCLMFSLSVMAENTNEVTHETIPEVSHKIPQGSRGDMGMPNVNSQFGGQMPGGMRRFPDNMQNQNPETQDKQPKGFWDFVKTYSTPITSVILLIFAYIFVIFYRRKNY